MPTIRPATLQDCAVVLAFLREADKREIEANRGNKDYGAAIVDCFTQSSHCFCIADDDDSAIAIYGVVPDPNCPTAGIVWMTATIFIGKIKVWFLRHSDEIINSVSIPPYEVLWNLIDLRNDLHIKWLKLCDFTLDIVHPALGPEERPFQMFHKRIIPKSEAVVCAI